jgi:transporter family protein
MDGVLLLFLPAVLYGLYTFSIKISSEGINQIAGAVILQVVAALLGVVGLVGLMVSKAPILTTARGVWMAVCAGVFVGLAEISTYYVFSRGVPVSVGLPIIVGGTVVTGAVLGLWFLRESLGLIQYAGIGLIVVGAVLLTIK